MHSSQQLPLWPKPGASVSSHLSFHLNWTFSQMFFTQEWGGVGGLICPETMFCLFLWRTEGLRAHLRVDSLSSLRGAGATWGKTSLWKIVFVMLLPCQSSFAEGGFAVFTVLWLFLNAKCLLLISHFLISICHFKLCMHFNTIFPFFVIDGQFAYSRFYS